MLGGIFEFMSVALCTAIAVVKLPVWLFVGTPTRPLAISPLVCPVRVSLRRYVKRDI
jgi:hypothetical protein